MSKIVSMKEVIAQNKNMMGTNSRKMSMSELIPLIDMDEKPFRNFIGDQADRCTLEIGPDGTAVAVFTVSVGVRLADEPYFYRREMSNLK